MQSTYAPQTTKMHHFVPPTKKKSKLLSEDLQIVAILEQLKTDLDKVYSNFNQVTDPILIDSYIYEVNSIYMRYKYYLSLCRERNIISDGFETTERNKLFR